MNQQINKHDTHHDNDTFGMVSFSDNIWFISKNDSNFPQTCYLLHLNYHAGKTQQLLYLQAMSRIAIKCPSLFLVYCMFAIPYPHQHPYPTIVLRNPYGNFQHYSTFWCDVTSSIIQRKLHTIYTTSHSYVPRFPTRNILAPWPI